METKKLIRFPLWMEIMDVDKRLPVMPPYCDDCAHAVCEMVRPPKPELFRPAAGETLICEFFDNQDRRIAIRKVYD